MKHGYSPSWLIVGEAHVFTVKVEFAGCQTGHVPLFCKIIELIVTTHNWVSARSHLSGE